VDDCSLLVTYIYIQKRKEKETSLFYSTEYLKSYFFSREGRYLLGADNNFVFVSDTYIPYCTDIPTGELSG